MFKKLAAGGAVVAVGVLLATNPTVVEAAGQITGADIKNNSIASKDIKNNTIKAGDVADGALTGQDIGDGSVSLADLGANSVNSSKIGDGTVTSGDIADGTVTSGDIADGTVTSGDVANGTLSNADLTAGSIGIARGYAWNSEDSPGIGVATPLTNGYTYNSSGGAVSVTRSAVGVYSVTFAGLSWSPGNVQVSGYGDAPVFCNVGEWSSPAVSVRCYNAAGAPADSTFTVAVFE